MNLIKYLLIGKLVVFNGLISSFYSNNIKTSYTHTISRNWRQTSDTGWLNLDFNESNFIKPNKVIKSMRWQVGINAEYYGWQYSTWQDSSINNNKWFQERSTNGLNSYPFQIQVWRDWWTCGNSALMLEMKINGSQQRLLKFQKTFPYCWKLDYSTGFKINFQFNYEDQYENQLDDFSNDVRTKSYKIVTPTTDLDHYWRDEKGVTTLRQVVTNDLINNVIRPSFNKNQKKFGNNSIFKNINDFKKDINIKTNGNKKVSATFRPSYRYDNIIYRKDISIDYNLEIDPNADYYQKNLNVFFANINKNFKIKVANFTENGSWEKSNKKTNINNEIIEHLNGEIKNQIVKLEQKNIKIFQFDKFSFKSNFQRLNNNQVKLTLNAIKYRWNDLSKDYQVFNDINIIYDLELDREYLSDDIDQRIKFFVNNEQQSRREIEMIIDGKKQKILAFNEKVNLEFYPERNNDARESVLEEIFITSSINKPVKTSTTLSSDSLKYPWVTKATLDEPESEKDEDGKIKDEVIYYHIKVNKKERDKDNKLTGKSIEIYNKSVLIKETNPGIQFEYETDVNDETDSSKKKVVNILPETVIYNEQLDKVIPNSFSLETKHILLDNNKIVQIFANISSWLISTNATKPRLKQTEIPYLKKITEVNNKKVERKYIFEGTISKEWEIANTAWTGINNGYVDYTLETVFSQTNPKYTIHQIDEEIASILEAIPKLKEKIKNEREETKQKELEEQLKKLQDDLYKKMINMQKKQNTTSFWDSNLGNLIQKNFRTGYSKQYFLQLTLQETKVLINEFIEWMKQLIFPYEKDPLEDKKIEDMNDQDKANYLARRIIEIFDKKSINFSSTINSEIIFNEKFNIEVKKRIISWMNGNEKALTILKDPKTILKFKVLDDEQKQLNKIKIADKPISKILEIRVSYVTKDSNFTPKIKIIFRVGNPDDDLNPDIVNDDKDKTNDDKKDTNDDKKNDDKTNDKSADDNIKIDDDINNDKILKRNIGIIIGSVLGACGVIGSVTVIFYIRKFKKIN